VTRRGYEMLGLISQIGISVVLTVGLAAWAGSFLDARLSTRPYLTLIGSVIGVVAAFRNINTLLESFFTGKGRGDK
jgi:F0F1-type ATP synthase assembly protein I